MTTHLETIRDHYQASIADRRELLARVNAAVDALEPPLNARRLAPLDQFHMGGLAATVAFAERIGLVREARVLDAGSGLGGPARYLAETYGCRIDGVDLSPDYVAVARLLTDRVGLGGLISFQVGDLTELAFDEGSFDLVWTQHVAMNIPNRAKLYREFRRVLKPGGRLAFYDPLAADGHPELIFPVPWAQTADMSTLLTREETREILTAARLEVGTLNDVTDEAIGWAAQQKPPQAGGVNTGMIVGGRMAEMAANFVRNLREGRVRLGIGIALAV